MTEVAKTSAIRLTLRRASELCGGDLADAFMDMADVLSFTSK